MPQVMMNPMPVAAPGQKPKSAKAEVSPAFTTIMNAISVALQMTIRNI